MAVGWARTRESASGDSRDAFGFPGRAKTPFDGHRCATPTPALDDDAQAQIARIIAIWEGTLGRYGKEGGFLCGTFTIADAFYAPVVTRFETYSIHLPAVAQAYAQRILALGPMREWAAAAKAEAAAR